MTFPRSRANTSADCRGTLGRRGSRHNCILRVIPSIAILGLLHLPAGRALAQPEISNSYFVPQIGPVASPVEGTLATRNFRMCPNNDGGSSLPNNARIKVVILDVNFNPIAGVPAEDICLLFNGGTAAQGFVGVGSDSIVANSTWNQDPLCPDVRDICADAATDSLGVTYITFAGAEAAHPGVAVRDPNRKWGHYDSKIPVYVMGIQIAGRLTTASAPGSYTLRIKNYDVVEGLGPSMNEGEAVTGADLSAIMWGLFASSPISYWLDFDSSGSVTVIDFNLLITHFNHDCDTPNNP